MILFAMIEYKEILTKCIQETIRFCENFFKSIDKTDLQTSTMVYEEYISLTLTNIFSKHTKTLNSISELRLTWDENNFPFHISRKKVWKEIEVDSISKYKDKFILTEIKLGDKFSFGKHKSDIGRMCYLLKKSKDISWCNFILFDIKNKLDLSKDWNVEIIEKNISDFIDIARMRSSIKKINDDLTSLDKLNNTVKIIIIQNTEKNIMNGSKNDDLEKMMFHGTIDNICLDGIENSIINIENLISKNIFDFEFYGGKTTKDYKILLEQKNEIFKESNKIFAPNVLKSKNLTNLYYSKLYKNAILEKLNEEDFSAEKISFHTKKATYIFKKMEENKTNGLQKETSRRADVLVVLIKKYFLNEVLSSADVKLFKLLKKLLEDQNLNLLNEKNPEADMKSLALLSVYYLKKLHEVDAGGVLGTIIKWNKSLSFEINNIYAYWLSNIYITDLNFKSQALKANNAEFPDIERGVKGNKDFVDDMHAKISYFKQSNIKIYTKDDKVPNFFFYYKLNDSFNYINDSKAVRKKIKVFKESLKDQILDFNEKTTKDILEEIKNNFLEHIEKK